MSGFARRFANAVEVQAAIDTSQTAQDTALADVADAAKGSGRSGFDVALGYVARTIGWALKQQRVSVAWFAVGGVTDSAAIVAAINWLPANGGTVYFPARATDYVTATITLPLYPKCIEFEGAGREASVLRPLNQDQPVLQSAGQVAGIGGVRFRLRGIGIRPHASGSTGMAIDMRNMSNCRFSDWGFVHNGVATFAVGVELYAQDSGGGASHCYYNVFDGTEIIPTTGSTTLPVKKAVKIYGNSGNHRFHRLKIVGASAAPTTTPLVSIASYCRHNIFEDNHFEGTVLTGAGITVFEDAGYGTKISAYFEATGQPYYTAAEIETGSREWSVLERCSFAAGTVSAASDALMAGTIVRDCYAFGSDANALAFIRRQEKIQRAESIAFNYTGVATLKARTKWLNIQNFYLTINDDGAGNRVQAEGAAALVLQSTAGGGQWLLQAAVTGAAGAAIGWVGVLSGDHNRNLSMGNQPAGANAVGVLAMANATAPTTSPAGGGQQYVEGGALKYRGSAGTVTVLAPA
jgi:hypothetical protein